MCGYLLRNLDISAKCDHPEEGHPWVGHPEEGHPEEGHH